MKKLSTMSRTKLVCDLLTPSHPVAVSDVWAAYRAPRNSSAFTRCEKLVRHKLAVAREILLRDLAAQMRSRPVLSSPRSVRTWLKLRCAPLEHEVFIVLYLDIRNRLIDDEEISRGTLSHNSIYPRELVKSALAHNAASVILAHNHPSGDPEPSASDCALTRDLTFVLSMMEIRIVDHFIVTGSTVVSFAEKGLL